ncbi:MAG: Nramp family divalent metal transporter [Planctomycetota bacterium]|nr:Nramp family divalent metal transporter [Planctomycetota bacterium]
MDVEKKTGVIETSSDTPSSTQGAKSALRFMGPGFLVAAAFIGPGTVNTAVKAGGSFGFQLLWAVLFAGLATVIFQEMAARLGLVTQKGLAESIKEYFVNSRLSQISVGLVIAAIVFGNTAYQAGNLSGAAKGLHHFLPFVPLQAWLFLSSAIAFFLIWTGTLKSLKIVLMSMVVVMSMTFLIAAINSRPDFPELLSGCFSFDIPRFNIGILIAIIGTTVVPYNLFLHSSSIAEQTAGLKVDFNDAETESAIYQNREPPGEPTELDQALAGVRLDTLVAVWVGAFVTAAILITAAGTTALTLDEAADSLSGFIGGFGKGLFFVGLFAAGLTSAITAPLAAGYVFAGCFGHPAKADAIPVRRVAGGIVVVGYLVAACFGNSPEQVIFLAQVANGFVLPLVAVFLLIVMNSKKLLGPYRNHWRQNLFGGLVVVFVVSLGGYQLGKLFGMFN